MIQRPDWLGSGCELAALAKDRKRLAELLAMAEGDESRFLRLILFEAGFHAPAATTLEEFVSRLLHTGWRPVQPHFQEPKEGVLFVVAPGDGSVARVGLVALLHRATADGPILRDYFVTATHLPERGERIEVSAVAFWLVPPGG